MPSVKPRSVPGALIPDPPVPTYVIHADKGGDMLGSVGHRDSFLADAANVAVDAAGGSAVVTHERNRTQGRTLRVSTNKSDYKAVRVYEATSFDGSTYGRLITGAVALPDGSVSTDPHRIADRF